MEGIAGVYRSLMADTPENTAASMNEKPATPRTRSLWRRVRRAARVVAAVVLGLVCVLALVAWPLSYVRRATLTVIRDVSVVANSTTSSLLMMPSGPNPSGYEASGCHVSVFVFPGMFGINAWIRDISRDHRYQYESLITDWNAEAHLTPAMVMDTPKNVDQQWVISPLLNAVGITLRTQSMSSIGFRSTVIIIPLWIIILASGIPAFFLSRGVFWRRRGPDECVTCGYSRVGLPIGAACPECGSASGEKVKANAEDAEGSTEVAEGKE
ncbi:MAG: hypothetical protein IPK69_01180 [Phycisphaerales bacterium]|nr:MAG: hypothetical protein IPK69_01180 [Phycisphaerales bacterium]